MSADDSWECRIPYIHMFAVMCYDKLNQTLTADWHYQMSQKVMTSHTCCWNGGRSCLIPGHHGLNCESEDVYTMVVKVSDRFHNFSDICLDFEAVGLGRNINFIFRLFGYLLLTTFVACLLYIDYACSWLLVNTIVLIKIAHTLTFHYELFPK